MIPKIFEEKECKSKCKCKPKTVQNAEGSDCNPNKVRVYFDDNTSVDATGNYEYIEDPEIDPVDASDLKSTTR